MNNSSSHSLQPQQHIQIPITCTHQFQDPQPHPHPPSNKEYSTLKRLRFQVLPGCLIIVILLYGATIFIYTLTSQICNLPAPLVITFTSLITILFLIHNLVKCLLWNRKRKIYRAQQLQGDIEKSSTSGTMIDDEDWRVRARKRVSGVGRYLREYQRKSQAFEEFRRRERHVVALEGNAQAQTEHVMEIESNPEEMGVTFRVVRRDGERVENSEERRTMRGNEGGNVVYCEIGSPTIVGARSERTTKASIGVQDATIMPTPPAVLEERTTDQKRPVRKSYTYPEFSARRQVPSQQEKQELHPPAALYTRRPHAMYSNENMSRSASMPRRIRNSNPDDRIAIHHPLPNSMVPTSVKSGSGSQRQQYRGTDAQPRGRGRGRGRGGESSSTQGSRGKRIRGGHEVQNDMSLSTTRTRIQGNGQSSISVPRQISDLVSRGGGGQIEIVAEENPTHSNLNLSSKGGGTNPTSVITESGPSSPPSGKHEHASNPTNSQIITQAHVIGLEFNDRTTLPSNTYIPDARRRPDLVASGRMGAVGERASVSVINKEEDGRTGFYRDAVGDATGGESGACQPRFLAALDLGSGERLMRNTPYI